MDCDDEGPAGGVERVRLQHVDQAAQRTVQYRNTINKNIKKYKLLIQEEQIRLQGGFYRFCNMFVILRKILVSWIKNRLIKLTNTF